MTGNLFQTAGKIGRIAGCAVVLAAVASCQSMDTRANVGPCPLAGSLYDAVRLVEITGGDRHENVAFTGEITGVRGFCRYVDDDPITMEIEIDFAFGKGPLAQDSRKSYPYFVSVTRRDRSVLGKQTMNVDVRSPEGRDVVNVTEKVDGIVIPRATETVSGSNFEILVGFDLTAEQLAYNRSGKRFLMDVEK
jgi:hypothetical protein